MAATTVLYQVEKQEQQRPVDGNLIITAKGSIVAVVNNTSEFGYGLYFESYADNCAATINGNVSLTSKLRDTAYALEIAAEHYTIKVGASKPLLQSTLTGSGDEITGAVVKGANLNLGSAGDLNPFGATFTSSVTATDNARALSYGLALTGRLDILSREFNSSVTSTARSAGGKAEAYGIEAGLLRFNSIGSTALFNVSATAGSKATEQNANAIAIAIENQDFYSPEIMEGGPRNGNFGARITVSAVAGSGAGADDGQSSAYAAGVKVAQGDFFPDIGMIGNSFSITAKSGNAAGSSARAVGIAYDQGRIVIGGFAAGIQMNISAAGPYLAAAYGINGRNSRMTINGPVNGTWNITAAGGDRGGDMMDESVATAAMIAAGDSLSIAGDLNAVITARASSNKGQSASASAISSGMELDIGGLVSGSVTVDAKVTGAGSTSDGGYGSEYSQACAAGFSANQKMTFGKGFAANFRLTATAAGIDSAEATAVNADAISGVSGPAGTWNVSATSTGGQVEGGFAGDAGAAGIRAEMGDVDFSTDPGAKLTLSVTASGNTLNLTSIESAESDAVGISAAGNIYLSELGLLTVTAKTGKTGGSSVASAQGLSGSWILLSSLAGMNITASADTNADASGIKASDRIRVRATSGAYNISATAAKGTATAAGFDSTPDGESFRYGGVNLGTVAAGAALTVKAAGGTLALNSDKTPVPETDSSATATGIRGSFFGYLPTLNVTATSGKNAESNTATAYGIRNETPSWGYSAPDSEFDSGAVTGLRRTSVTATAVDRAEAVGYQNVSLAGYENHVESVSAVSSAGEASATGYLRRFEELSDSVASNFFYLAGSLNVSARGVTDADAVGIFSQDMAYLNSRSQTQHKMTVTANATDGRAAAAALSASEVDLCIGLWADWRATATSTSGPAVAAMLHIDDEMEEDEYYRDVSGLNGTYAASATGKSGAEVYGFVAYDGELWSEDRDQNFSLTGNAKSSEGNASALGLSFDSIDFDSASYRDMLTLTADGGGVVRASGIEGSGTGDVAVETNSLFALTATAKSAAGNAAAYGISNTDGELNIELSGTSNISATGGKASSSEVDVSAIAYGVKGSERSVTEYQSPDYVSILQTLNVTAKSGIGAAVSGMGATAYGAYLRNGPVNEYYTLSSQFTSSAQTKATVKADGAGEAFAVGVASEWMEAGINGGNFAVTALSAQSRATAIGISAKSELMINEATLSMNISATGGKAQGSDSTDAIAFGLLAGEWNENGSLTSGDSFMSMETYDVYYDYYVSVLDGTLTVSAKTVAGAGEGSRIAHAAGLAAAGVEGASAETFKLSVLANAADQQAEAYGIQSCVESEDYGVDFDFQGNWKIAAVAATGSASAYGIGQTKSIQLTSLSSKTVLAVSAETDQRADAGGFIAENSFYSNGNLGLAMTVTATSRKGGFAGAIGIHAVNSEFTLDGTIAVTASGSDSSAEGIYSSGTMIINGVVAAAIAKTGQAYAIRRNDNSTSGLNIAINGAIFGGKGANASALVTQLSGLVRSGGSATSLLSAITPAPGSSDLYYAVMGSDFSDSLNIGVNAISVGDIDLVGEELEGGADTLTVNATSQVVGNVSGVEKIEILLGSDPGKNPIFTVRDSAGSLDQRLFATLDNAQLGTYVLAQGSRTDIGAMTGVSLVINNNTELLLGEISRELDTGAFGRLSLVTSANNMSKLVLEITYGPAGNRKDFLDGGNYVPPSGSSLLSLPDAEVPPAAGSSGLSFEEDFRLYGVGAADLQLGASDALFAEEQDADLFKRGLLAG